MVKLIPKCLKMHKFDIEDKIIYILHTDNKKYIPGAVLTQVRNNIRNTVPSNILLPWIRAPFNQTGCRMKNLPLSI